MDENNLSDYIKKFKLDSIISERILEYSLFMPKIEAIDSKNPENWVSEAVSQCFEKCHKNLFIATEESTFFGIHPSSIIIDGKNTISDLMQKNDDMGTKCMKGFSGLKHDFFAKTLLSHCLIAAYDTTMKLLPIDCDITSYALEIVNNKGFRRLMEEGLISKPSFKISKTKNSGKNDRSSDGANRKKAISTHISLYKLEGFKRFFEINTGKANIYSADILYSLTKVNAKTFNAFLELYNVSGNISDIEKDRAYKNWGHFCNVYGQLYTDILKNDIGDNDVDRLYYYYKLENILGLDLANNIFYAINEAKKADKHFLSGYDIYTMVAEISRFPNVFSRNLYLRYALSSAWESDYIYDSCFINSMPADGIYQFMDKKSDFNVWMLAFDKFCKFFDQLVFPVEEWYFFLTLKKTVDEHMGEKSSPVDKVLKLNEVLATYINANAQYIVHPFIEKYQKFGTPEKFGFSKENPDIAMILSFFDNAKSGKEFPLSSLSKESLIPKEKEGRNVGDKDKHMIQYIALMQQYISFITDN